MTPRLPALTSRRDDPDHPLLERVLTGDEQAFIILVQRYRPTMLRLAEGYVPNKAVAEEVVQEAWMGFLRGARNFEGRSSVRTWLFRILVNRARTAGVLERRSVAIGGLEAAVDAVRFDAGGNWQVPPQPWTDLVDDRLTAQKMAGQIRVALDDLPDRQREVVILRDIEGLSSREVCGVLDLTEANQRVLLHRGRSRLRQLLESEFGRA
jgi:RNA polymerase sigma-70 factor (ECF subfamily)